MNAAIWAGSAVFFTIAVWPAFASGSMERLLPWTFRDATFLILLERYFLIHLWCCVLAMIHMGVDWLYTGKPIARLTMGLLIGLACCSLFGGYLMQPSMVRSHAQRVHSTLTVEQRKKADSAYGIMYGMTQLMNLAMVGGVLLYCWRVGNPPNPPRFISANRFKG